MTRFGSWRLRSRWIPPTCSEVRLKTIEITGSGPLTQSPPMLGAKWQTTVSVYYVSRGFPRWNDLHRWSGLIISQAVVFPHIGKTRSPPTSSFIQINIPWQFGRVRQGKYRMGRFSFSWLGDRSVGNLQFTVPEEIRKYTQILLDGRHVQLKSQCFSALWLITSCTNIPHCPSSPFSNIFASLVSERGKKVPTEFFLKGSC